jgi:hypothetical protein
MSPHQDRPNDHSAKAKQGSFVPLFLIIILVLVLFCGGVWLYFNFTKTNKVSAPAVLNTTSAFLNFIKEGNLTSAYNLFGDDLKKEYPGGINDFTASAKKANLQTIKDWAISKVETNGNKDRIIVKGTAIFNTPNPTGRLEFAFYKTPAGEYKMYLWQIYPEL